MLAVAGVGVAAASAYYLANRPQPTIPPFDLDNQTIVEVTNLKERDLVMPLLLFS